MRGASSSLRIMLSAPSLQVHVFSRDVHVTRRDLQLHRLRARRAREQAAHGDIDRLGGCRDDAAAAANYCCPRGEGASRQKRLPEKWAAKSPRPSKRAAVRNRGGITDHMKSLAGKRFFDSEARRWFRVREEEPVMFDEEESCLLIYYFGLDKTGEGEDDSLFAYECTPWEEFADAEWVVWK